MKNIGRELITVECDSDLYHNQIEDYLFDYYECGNYGFDDETEILTITRDIAKDLAGKWVTVQEFLRNLREELII